MRITIAEERDGHLLPARDYDASVITVGRASSCDLVFDGPSFPMVSRSHAEFRLSSGHYLLVDKGSTFGTFVDGRPVNGYVEVHDGMRVQFGIEGPIIRVCYVDDTDDAVAKVPSQPGISPENRDRIARHAAIQSPILRQSAEFPPTGHAIEARLEIIGEGSTPSKTFPIIKDVTRLGRDSELEVRLEASAVVVSRIHAEIRRSDGQFQLIDLNSYNGTFLNGVRISKPTELSDGDRLELGLRGPVLRFYDPASAKDEGGIVLGGSEVMAPPYSPPPPIKTVVAGTTSAPLKKTNAEQMETKLLTRRLFGQKTQIVVGRAQNSDVCLDGLLISNRHAVFIREGEVVYVEDAGSTNGVYLNGARVPGRQPVGQQDLVQIGPFLLRASTAAGVSVYDTRAKTRIDVIEVTKNIRNSIGGGTIQLLNGVSLTIRPNEFVGLLGPSGAGKSTLMDALNGMRPATSGQVLINRFDLYQHLDYLKQQIGYVPQDDIIHRELTVYRTLYYVAKLRLSGDVSEQEIDQIVSEVIDLTGLTERRAVPVSQLSGGQRKRVSIAVELIIKPAIIFLDEPTSGLDPATEEKIMVLFRQLAESGRTVILTTHAMENVKLFDKIAIMLRGRLVFYGAPHEALAYVGAESFKELYDKLEAPAVAKPAGTKVPRCGATKDQTADKIAEEWSERFKRTIQYRRNVIEPATEVVSREGSAPPRVGHSPMEAARQLLTLTHRYAEVLRRDKFNLLILFGQAPIIALLTYLVVGVRATRDFPYFMLALVAIWFGTSISAREIVRERPIYNRERMVNLKLLPYVGSKLLVLSLTVGLQCALLFGSLKLFHAAGLMELPGSYGGLPQFGLMVLTGAVGVAIGLLVSALVKTSEMATSIVPLILIPQILFSGLVGVPEGTAKIVGLAMPATWAFDGMKRLSELDVLRGRDEGGETPTKNEGRGLYKQTEFENDQNIEEAKRKIELYKADAEKSSGEFAEKMDDFQKDLAAGRPSKKPDAPKLGPAPSVGAATRVPSDLSNYIDFLHPLGGIWRNAAVLVVMFLGLTAAIIMVLRLQDIK